jgi:tetratricopeptide (TPR) repeat protein
VHTDTCEATRIRGEQSDEVLTERMLCLSRAHAEARALIAELGQADAAAVGRAIDSVRSLPPLDECSDVESLMTPLAPPRRIRTAVENVREALAEARAIRSTGRHAKALAKSTRAAEDAEQLDHAPVLAEVWLEVGRSQAHRGRFVEAQGSLREAIHQAARGHHDRVAAEAWIDLVFLEGAVGEREEVALALWDAARAAIARIPGHPELEAKLDSTAGIIEASLGEYAVALSRHQAALAAWERAYGKRALEAGMEHHRLAEVLLAMHRVDEAEDHAVRSQDILRHTHGAGHPILALPLTVLAEVACKQGDFLECGRRIERAMGLRSSTGTPPDHPTFLPKRLILVRALAGAGKIEDARRELDAALAIVPDDLWRARALLVKAEIDRDREGAREALELMQANLPATHPELREALQEHEFQEAR